MCQDEDGWPPEPPVRGAVAGHGEIVMTSADGTRFGGYVAGPAHSAGVGVVILPDARGLHSYYRRLAVRFAEAGLDAVAIDYFGRTASLGERGEAFDYQSHIERVIAQPQQMVQDAAAAVDYLRSSTGPSVEAVFSVGFCLGGSWSWRLAASEAGLAGCIGFYGPPSLVADVVDQLRAPLLVLVAGADAVTPQQEFTGFARHVTEQGIRNEMYVYDGAPHSFFDRAFAQWQDACADAWQRMLDFIGRYTKPASPRLG